jgi:hypothetical protein
MNKQALYIPYKEYEFSSPGRRSYDTCCVKWPDNVPFPYPDAIEKGEQPGHHTVSGPWGQMITYRALAVSHDTDRGITVHGERQLTDPQPSGYDLKGRVSIAGERRRAFTSSQMFEVQGKLVDVAILYVCGKKDKTED